MPNFSKPKLLDSKDLCYLIDDLKQKNVSELILLGPWEKDLKPVTIAPTAWRKGAVVYQLRERVPRLVSKLSALEELRSLDLRFNQIDDSDAEFLAKFKQLTFLDLAHNRIGGSGLKALSYLSQLITLKLTDNGIDESAAPCLSGLTQLNSLYLGRNCLGNAGAESLRSLDQLSYLDLKSNKIDENGVVSLLTLRKLKALDLFNNRIGPKGAKLIATLSQLRWLNLWNNNVGTEGVAHLKNLSQLTFLELGNNEIGDEGAKDLSNLPHLNSLQLGSNEIGDDGASFLATLTQLTSLDLSSNLVGDEGAASLAALTQLTSLDLSRNRIGDAGAASLSTLTQLTSLGLSSNRIGDVSLDALSRLGELETIDLSENQIVNPKPLRELKKLRQLNLSRTSVSDLSSLTSMLRNGLKAIWNRKGGYGINLYECPIVRPPVDTILQGHEAVLSCLAQLEEQGTDYLYEAKVLILGKGGAGKTSLLRRLYQPELPLPTEDESTKGIDIHCHEFTTSNDCTFRLNVWDFGGQQIYHATHQFFLTRRSLYILVDDTRGDDYAPHDDGFKDWLEMIETLSDGSPVLIFQNEKGGRSKIIDTAGIMSRFKMVKAVCSGNLDRPGSADDLADLIRKHAQQLPHVGAEVPAGWLAIRSELEAIKQQNPYISRKEYFKIYGRHLEPNRDKALRLSRFFHDLGVFLHFQDELLLERVVILQNDWATEAVFRILNDEAIKTNSGYFTEADCRRVWIDFVYTDKYPELLALMVRFELCYELQDQVPKTWLAPQLLPPSIPEVVKSWPKADDLVLTYQYDFLPKGLINRLMVRMHRFVRHLDRSWRNGAFFEREDNELLAQVVSPSGREIELRARGTNRKDLLKNIESDLDALNNGFPGLEQKIKKLIPCCCTECCDPRGRTFLYDKKDLLRAQHKNVSHIQCHRSFEMVSLSQLLDDLTIFPPLRTYLDETSESEEEDNHFEL
jgi:internalin A